MASSLTEDTKLVSMFHPTLNKLKPSDYTLVSAKKVWWFRESCGHSWYARISDMGYSYQSKTEGCPYCNGKKVLEGFNDLLSQAPRLAADWDYEKNELRPEEIHCRSHKVVNWVCSECGDESTGAVTRRAEHLRGRYDTKTNFSGACKKCRWGLNIAIKHPDLASQFMESKNGRLASSIAVGSTNSYWWHRESCGHTWVAAVRDRINHPGCPFCSNHRLEVGVNDLLSLYPEIAARYTENNEYPVEVMFPGSPDKVQWYSDGCGHVYERRISREVVAPGCPTCKAWDVSLAEKRLFELLSDEYVNIASQKKLGKHETSFRGSFDIYLEDYHTLVEYDGSHWHKNSYEADTLKTTSALDAGYVVIRVRARTLGSLEIDHPNYHEYFLAEGEYNTTWAGMLDWINAVVDSRALSAG